MSDDLLVDVDEHGVMLATFNRPERMNALSDDLRRGLLDALDQASRDDAVKVLVLTGNGRAFCAGAEVGATTSPASSDQPRTPSRHARLDHRGESGRTVEAFVDCDVPVIAAINGPAVGAGFGLACCADIRIMGSSARVSPIFIKRGVASDYGASYWLPRIVGVARAYEIFFEGDLVNADRALEIGLANRVVPDELLMDEAIAYARRIAAGPPLAYTYVRRLIQRSTDMPVHEFAEMEWLFQSNLLGTSDASEGFRSFAEQRPPEFTGQ
ncbi:MAG: enoyl-CoA hydratase-related protein [Dehalococcoidia bacterium]|jgi:2-(1,2-epoxy-1,2-dihydrophenyl)acetyl-CoA isomerase|nr:enoyl-CoA hydratase-related protein [Dehalococcoidia bacterium]